MTRYGTILLAACGLVAAALPAAADIGWGWSIACDLQLDEPVCLLVAPGGGDDLSQARRFGGAYGERVDASFGVTVRNDGGEPLVGLPAEDLWIRTRQDGDLTVCPGGTIADSPTDAEGRTTFSGPLSAGGHAEIDPSNVLTVFAATYVLDYPVLPIRLVSPDLNGDLRVDLTDVHLFALDYFDGYQGRSDLYWDGLINLSDIALFAAYVNTSCATP